MIRFVFAIFLSLCGVANAQLAGGIQFPGPGLPVAASSYQGPGDIVASPAVFGSCARTVDAAHASTATSLCDLVDSSAPTVVICTLRGSSTGFVDLAGTYCTGSVAPSAKCAAATGAVCNVSKVYDQTGNTTGWVQATALNQPVLTFSAANGLPGMTGSQGNNTQITLASFTLAQGFTFASVYKRTGGTAAIGGIFGSNGSAPEIRAPGSINQFELSGGNGLQTVSATDNAFHASMGIISTAGLTSFPSVDGVDGTAAPNTGSFSAGQLRIFRAGGSSLTGIVMEVGIWPVPFAAGTQTLNMSANQRSATNGYNF